jgi:hypothetical protein
VLKQLIIGLNLATITVTTAIGSASADLAKVAPGGGIQVTIQLLPSQQRPNLTKADVDAVQKTVGSRIKKLGLATPIFQPASGGKLIVKLVNKTPRTKSQTSSFREF